MLSRDFLIASLCLPLTLLYDFLDIFFFSSFLSGIVMVVVGNIAPPPSIDVHVLVPRSRDHIILWWENFADVIKWKILRRRDSPGLSGWAPWNHQRPHKGKPEGQSRRRRCYNRSRASSEGPLLLALKMQEGKGVAAKECGSLWK